MANLKEVKNRINSVKSTQQITKAMKMVAAAKLRRAQDRIVQIRPYSEKLSSILNNVSSTLGDSSSSNVYGEQREVKNVLIVLITSDRGLCGGFNANIQKATINNIKEKYSGLNVELLTIGTKGRDFFKRRDYNLTDSYSETFQNLIFDEVRKAAEYAMDGFKEGKYDKVDLIYNEFKNVATQIVRVDQFLPIVEENAESEEKSTELDYIFEPSKTEIVETLIPKALKITFYKALLESNASEHGARMTAMDKATDNASELLKELKLTYNRTRQAAITTEILEIVSGAEALAQG